MLKSEKLSFSSFLVGCLVGVPFSDSSVSVLCCVEGDAWPHFLTQSSSSLESRGPSCCSQSRRCSAIMQGPHPAPPGGQLVSVSPPVMAWCSKVSLSVVEPLFTSFLIIPLLSSTWLERISHQGPSGPTWKEVGTEALSVEHTKVLALRSNLWKASDATCDGEKGTRKWRLWCH